jgi:transcriptional antiterminator RfaH
MDSQAENGNDCAATETCCTSAMTMPARPSAGTHWYCLYTKPHQEQQVSAVFSQNAIEVYLPLLSCRKRLRGQHARQPLFPCYLFARMDLEKVGTSLVRWTPGLRDLVRGADGPARVSPGIIQWIQEQLASGECERRLQPHFAPGERVRITAGALRDLTAIFERRLTGSERAQVLVFLLGRSTLVELDMHLLEKSAAQAQANARKPARLN